MVFKSKLSPGISVLLCLFNCALLMHLASNEWYYYKTTLVVMFMLCLQVVNYRLWWATAVSVIACFILFLPKMPRVANHLNLEIGTGFIILGFMLYRCLGFKNRISPTAITLTIRYVLIALYFIAGFHKLNSGFFNIDGTCAAQVNLFTFGRGHALPAFLIRIAQFATIAIEMVLPFGLLHYKLRKFTIAALALFHFYLIFCGFVNFSAFALFMLAGSCINLSLPNSGNIKKHLKIYMLCCIAATLFMAGLCAFSSLNPWMLQLCMGVIFCIGYLFFLWALVSKETVVKQSPRFSVVPLLAVIMVTLWGMQSFAGLSTARSLNMYSNVITEKSRCNHYIIDTNKTKIWDFEEDYVTIVQLPEGAVWSNPLPINQCDVPLIEFKKMAKKWSRKNTKVTCTLIYKNKRIYIPDLKNSAFSKTKWWYRFLSYRIIPKDGANPCMW